MIEDMFCIKISDNTFKCYHEIREIRLTRQVNRLHVERATSIFHQN